MSNPNWKILPLPGKWQIRARWHMGSVGKVGFMISFETKKPQTTNVINRLEASIEQELYRVFVFWKQRNPYIPWPFEFQHISPESSGRRVVDWPKRKKPLTRPRN